MSGVYSSGVFAINGTLTLDGANNPNAVFVFQSAATLDARLGDLGPAIRVTPLSTSLVGEVALTTNEFKTAERLKRVIAINLVIAWRIMLMTLLGRDCPGLPAEILFSDVEIEVLAAYAKKRGSPSLPRLATPYAS